MKLFQLLFSGLVVFFSCSKAGNDTDFPYSFPASYDYPNSKKITLPKSLAEISGIAFHQESIWAVNDEQGILYQVDIETGKILKKVEFGKKGDYEDLVIIGATAWVLKSNGDLYQVRNFESETFETEIFEFPLMQERDFETLLFLENENSLLLICKTCEWDKGKSESSIFGFDLEQREYNPAPWGKTKKSDWKEILSKEQSKNLKIAPSAIAIHPKTGDLFMISHTGKWLMITDARFQPKEIHFLDPLVFTQPEGITFDREGNLFISNESKAGDPHILKFQAQN
jgi:hypothetical protein